MIGRPGAVVLMASGGDEELVDLRSHPCWAFPEARDGGWAGFDPVDGARRSITWRRSGTRGAEYFVLPKPAFGWRHRYPELFEHLERDYRRVHQDEHLVIYDLARRGTDGVRLDPLRRAHVRVVGTYAAHDRPPPGLLTELARAGADGRAGLANADDTREPADHRRPADGRRRLRRVHP